MIKDDYKAVGVPMLPVVRGDRFTAAQIGLYAIWTTLFTLIPVAMGELHAFYLMLALVLNALLLQRSWKLYRQIERPVAVSLYKYSMLYLALLFMGMAIDRALF
jgi:protoheme IX farnesyltransferase